MSMKNSSDTIGNRTRDLPTCSAVPQPTALLRWEYNIKIDIEEICSYLVGFINLGLDSDKR